MVVRDMLGKGKCLLMVEHCGASLAVEHVITRVFRVFGNGNWIIVIFGLRALKFELRIILDTSMLTCH